MSEPKGKYITKKQRKTLQSLKKTYVELKKDEFPTFSWGGSRGGGRPRKLKGGKYIKVYVDEDTIKKLKQISKNQSEAVRMAVKSHPLP